MNSSWTSRYLAARRRQSWKRNYLAAAGFEPSQPRDEDGEWSETGAGGKGGAKKDDDGSRDANFDPAGSPAQFTRKIREVLPEVAKLPEPQMLSTLHRMAGAPPSWVSWSRSTANGIKVIAIDNHDGNMNREFIREGGKVICLNRVFELPKERQGRGEGLKIFHNQVKELAAQGVSEIRCLAARDDGEYNGYYTWARLGYDAPLPMNVRIWVPPLQIRKVNTVQKLMAIPGGREIWKKRGQTIDMKFDLTPGSLSRRILEAYMSEKGKDIRGTAGDDKPELFDFDKAGPEIDDADEALLDRIWKDVASEAADDDPT